MDCANNPMARQTAKRVIQLTIEGAAIFAEEIGLTISLSIR
jgi:hypothetical protein